MSEPKDPTWLQEAFDTFNSTAKNIFLLHGNTADIFLGATEEKSLPDYIAEKCGNSRKIIIMLDPSSGIAFPKGKELLGGFEPGSGSPVFQLHTTLLFLANLPDHHPAAVFITNAGYLFGKDNDPLDCLLLKRWSEDPHFKKEQPFIVLLSEALNDIHPLIKNSQRIEKIEIPFPNEDDIQSFLEQKKDKFALALGKTQTPEEKTNLYRALAGTSLQGLDSILRKQNYRKAPLLPDMFGAIKRKVIEEESRGMLSFLPTTYTLNDLSGENISAVKTQFEEDILLWKKGRFDLAPNGYLLCGPPGTGKSWFVRCLSGSARIPVIKMNNFRGENQGNTESNLELNFRLVKSIPRVYLFIDEAEQWLGSRDSSRSDGGVGARVYSYFAQEMSNPENKGRICWILATSHPHMLEIDLKRPGRIDVKIPLFPCGTPQETDHLIRSMAAKRKLSLGDEPLGLIPERPLPELLTPGSVSALLDETIRKKEKCEGKIPDLEILQNVLANYQTPNPEKTLELIRYAIEESSSKEFIPPTWK